MIEQNITIHYDDNICTTCGKAYMHRRRHYIDDNMKCVELITAHPGCRSLINRIRKLKDELLDLEYTLYCRKI
jgi:hypothetical protein